MTTESREPTLADVITRLDRIDTDIHAFGERMDTFEAKLEKTDIKFDAYVKASDRLLGVATTIIITAGTVTILSPFVQQGFLIKNGSILG